MLKTLKKSCTKITLLFSRLVFLKVENYKDIYQRLTKNTTPSETGATFLESRKPWEAKKHSQTPDFLSYFLKFVFPSVRSSQRWGHKASMVGTIVRRVSTKRLLSTTTSLPTLTTKGTPVRMHDRNVARKLIEVHIGFLTASFNFQYVFSQRKK